jgi:hypothetical protein
MESIQYGPDSIHARGIQKHKKNIYTANSNGQIYCLNLKTKKYTQLTTKPNIELRDIYVKDKSNFLAMQSDDTCVLVHASNDNKKGFLFSETKYNTFLDGMDINKNGFGILVGDPVNNYFQVFLTSNFGDDWKQINNENLKAKDGEACFAASGTICQVVNDSTYYFVSGGITSFLYHSSDYGKTWNKKNIPFNNFESSGPFSMRFWNEKEGIVVGGDYLMPNDTTSNCFFTKDGGISWVKPKNTTSGYKSCVIKAGKILYACGTNGIDVSNDLGLHWFKIGNENTFSMTFDKKYIYATSKNGKLITFKRF